MYFGRKYRDHRDWPFWTVGILLIIGGIVGGGPAKSEGSPLGSLMSDDSDGVGGVGDRMRVGVVISQINTN